MVAYLKRKLDSLLDRSGYPPIGRTAVWTIYSTFFLDLFQLSCLIPLFRSIVASVSDSNEQTQMRLGLVASVCAVAETVMSPMTGAMSDRFGRRRMTLLGTVGSGVAALIYSNSVSIEMVIAGRLCKSLAGSSMAHTQTSIADITSPEERPNYMIVVTTLAGLAFTIGPIVGGILNTHVGLQATCRVSAVIAFANTALVFFFFKETHSLRVASPSTPATQQQQTPLQQGQSERPKGRFGDFQPLIWLLFMSVLFVSPLHVAFEICANTFVTDLYFDGDTERGTEFFSKCYSCIGLSLLVVSLFIYKRLQRRIGITGTVLIGGCLGFIGLALSSSSPTPVIFLLSTIVWAFGGQLVHPAVPLLITRLSSPTSFGKAFGLYKSFGNIARIISPPIFTRIFEFNRPFVFWVLAVFKLVAALICYFVAAASSPPKKVSLPAAAQAPSPLAAQDGAGAMAEPEQEAEPGYVPAELWKAGNFDFARQLSEMSDANALQFGSMGSHLIMLRKPTGLQRRRCVSEEFPKQVLALAGTELQSRSFAGA